MATVKRETINIEDTSLTGEVLGLLKTLEGQAYIAGGYAREQFIFAFGIPLAFDLDLEPSDIDIFAYSKLFGAEIIKRLLDFPLVGELLGSNTLVSNYIFPDSDLPPVQFILPANGSTVKTSGTVEEQFERFNFHSSQFGMEYSEGKIVFYYTEEAVADLKYGRLHINAISSPIGMARRVNKDVRKGFTISLKELTKLFVDWSNRTPEYRSAFVMLMNYMAEDADDFDLDYQLLYEEDHGWYSPLFSDESL